MTGKVKFWNPAGWGIITPHGVRCGDRSQEAFIHATRLPEGVTELFEGQEVEFSLVPNFGERRVLSLRLLTKHAYVPIDTGKKVAAYGD